MEEQERDELYIYLYRHFVILLTLTRVSMFVVRMKFKIVDESTRDDTCRQKVDQQFV